ncbi:MAG: trehalose-6-phosphate synthase, partial [Betaproteobacteria bacterium]
MLGRRLRSISLPLRFIAPLTLTLAVLAYAIVPLVDSLTLRWWTSDLDIRARLIANTMQDQLGELVAQEAGSRINSLFTRALQDERLYAIALCTPDGQLTYRTVTYPDSLGCHAPRTNEGLSSAAVRLPHGLVHVVEESVLVGEHSVGTLMLIHDMSFVERRSADTRRYLIIFFVVLGIVISLVTVLVAHLSWRGWLAGMRALLRGEGIVQPFGPQSDPDLQPLVSDLRALLHQVDVAHRPRDQNGPWNPEMLRSVLREHFRGDQILLLSNREPYLHVREASGKIVVRRPASGLVTAMEPIMRACSGTWVAHGSGSADREVVDRHDHMRVPPDHPSYTLRRVWLSPEEEQGYYYGFANEGLWPLCHFAHVRPVFRSADWAQYIRVNRRFADAVAAEARTEDPVVLIQDYHFALAPRLISERLPKATIITFWHIPWPNAESFGICPWRDEILSGMLGSSILGFH